MRPIESKFKVYQQDPNKHDYFSGLVDERAYFEVYPNAIDYEYLAPTKRNIAGYLQSNIMGEDGTLMRQFEKDARIFTTTARTVRWTLDTFENDLYATYLKNYQPSNETPGVGGLTFEIGLDSDVYSSGNVVIFEGLRETPILFRSDGEPDGHIWKYEVVLLNTSNRAYFDFSLIRPGTRVISLPGFIGESTVERPNLAIFGSGGTKLEFEVPMSRFGWQLKVTDNAWYAATHFKLKEMDEKGVVKMNSAPILYNSLDMKFERAVNRQIDLWLVYGRSSGQYAGRFLDDLTERDIISGPGLYEFMESSYIYDYNVNGGSIKMFSEILSSLWNNKINPEDRVVEIHTGSGGLMLFDEWARAEDIKTVVQTEDWNYEKEPARFKGRTGVGLNAKDYISYHVKPFGKILVKYLPFLDNGIIETRKHGNLPITSYEFIVFDWGNGDARENANVAILRNNIFKQYGYLCGTWTPLGTRLGNGGSATNRFAYSQNPSENAFYYIYEDMVGLVLRDPSLLIWFRPSFA